MSEKLQPIGGIGNYYGGLWVKAKDQLRYWSVENYDGHGWEEIPENLYAALVEYERMRDGTRSLEWEDSEC